MGFDLYLFVRVKWVGTAPPANQLHPARHMARFDESFESLEEHHCYDEKEANAVKLGIVNRYGRGNCSVEVIELSEKKYEHFLGLRNEILNQLEELA
jgi:hypothetical protein